MEALVVMEEGREERMSWDWEEEEKLRCCQVDLTAMWSSSSSSSRKLLSICGGSCKQVSR